MSDTKTWVEFPGNVNLAFSPENYTGCKPIVFRRQWWAFWKPDPATQMNAYFQAHKGQLLVHVQPLYDGSILTFHTCSLSADELHVLETRANVVREEVERRLKQEQDDREAQEAKELAAKQEAEETAKKELERLRMLAKKGESCEKNHGGKQDVIAAEQRGYERAIATLHKGGWPAAANMLGKYHNE